MSEKPKTGLFPSFHPQRARDGTTRPRLGINGQTQLNEWRLRSIKDGNVVHFVDDGSGPSGPNSARQQIVRKIQQQSDGLPVFFLDEPNPSMVINFHGVRIAPAVANDAILARMAENIARRDASARQAVEEIALRMKAAASRTDAQANVFAAQSDAIGQASAGVVESVAQSVAQNEEAPAPRRRRSSNADQ